MTIIQTGLAVGGAMLIGYSIKVERIGRVVEVAFYPFIALSGALILVVGNLL